MADLPLLMHLYKAKAVTEADVVGAVNAYMTNPAVGEHRLGDHVLDLGAAVLASKFATDILASADSTDHQKRHAVRTALLVAAPAPAKP